MILDQAILFIFITNISFFVDTLINLVQPEPNIAGYLLLDIIGYFSPHSTTYVPGPGTLEYSSFIPFLKDFGIKPP
jgi:hypothetical protein